MLSVRFAVYGMEPESLIIIINREISLLVSSIINKCENNISPCIHLV